MFACFVNSCFDNGGKDIIYECRRGEGNLVEFVWVCGCFDECRWDVLECREGKLVESVWIGRGYDEY